MFKRTVNKASVLDWGRGKIASLLEAFCHRHSLFSSENHAPASRPYSLCDVFLGVKHDNTFRHAALYYFSANWAGRTRKKNTKSRKKFTVPQCRALKTALVARGAGRLVAGALPRAKHFRRLDGGGSEELVLVMVLPMLTTDPQVPSSGLCLRLRPEFVPWLGWRRVDDS